MTNLFMEFLVRKLTIQTDNWCTIFPIIKQVSKNGNPIPVVIVMVRDFMIPNEESSEMNK